MDATHFAVCQLIKTWAGKEPGPFVLPEGVSSNSVTTLLNEHFIEVAVAPILPAALKDVHFSARIKKSHDRTSFLLLELERVIPSITYDKCQPVVLKGAGLAQTLYTDPGQRWFIDLDVLVPLPEVDEVCRRLAEIGYKPFSGKNSPEYYDKYHLHRILVGPQGSCLEIHWDLTLPNSVYGFDVAGVFTRAREMSLGSITTLVAASVDQIFHGVYQNIADGYVDLRRILDFVLLMRSMETEDWLYIIKEAERTGMTKALALSLHMVKAIAGVEPPAQFNGEFCLGRTNARIFSGLNITEGCMARKGTRSLAYTTMLHLLLTPNTPSRLHESFLFLLPSEEALMIDGYWGPGMPSFQKRLRHSLSHLKTLTSIGGRMALALAKG